MTKWDRFFDEKIREIAQEKVVLDIGGGSRFQKDMKQYEPLFKGVDYQTLDSTAAYQPDIVGNIHSLPLKDGSVDAVICKAVLEHVHRPYRAVNEVHRVLRKGGKGLIYVPFLYAYHGNEVYGDYFRYTQDGIKYLFRKFRNVEACPVRGNSETLLCLTSFRRFKVLTVLCRFADNFFSSRQVSGYNVFVIK